MARQEDAGKGREMSKLHSESAKTAPATPSSPQEPVCGLWGGVPRVSSF